MQVCDITISTLSTFFKLRDSTKSTGPDEIPVVVIKNIVPKLTSILAKLVSCCLKKICFSSPWKVSSACPVYKNLDGPHHDISLLIVISKLFEDVNKKVAEHINKN